MLCDLIILLLLLDFVFIHSLYDPNYGFIYDFGNIVPLGRVDFVHGCDGLLDRALLRWPPRAALSPLLVLLSNLVQIQIWHLIIFAHCYKSYNLILINLINLYFMINKAFDN